MNIELYQHKNEEEETFKLVSFYESVWLFVLH